MKFMMRKGECGENARVVVMVVMVWRVIPSHQVTSSLILAPCCDPRFGVVSQVDGHVAASQTTPPHYVWENILRFLYLETSPHFSVLGDF